MGNMTYCRFENTIKDMKDCLRAIQDEGSIQNYVNKNDPSSYELNAIRRMKEVADRLSEWLEGAENAKYEDYEY